MADGLILVRHALPEVVQGVAASKWGLAERSREDCVLLAHHLPARLAPLVYASSQPKAAETAGVIALRRGLRVQADERLREADQDTGWVDDYEDLAASYLRGQLAPGWEPQAAVSKRFGEAVQEALEDAPNGADLVVVDHGLAMTLYLSTRVQLDREAFWRGLSFPDAWRMDLASSALSRVVPFSAPGVS